MPDIPEILDILSAGCENCLENNLQTELVDDGQTYITTCRFCGHSEEIPYEESR